jgi:hypothetical protein
VTTEYAIAVTRDHVAETVENAVGSTRMKTATFQGQPSWPTTKSAARLLLKHPSVARPVVRQDINDVSSSGLPPQRSTIVLPVAP